MDDYKELISLLADHTDGTDEGYLMYCAAGAIEQLVAKLKRATLRGEWQEVTLDRSMGKIKGYMCSKCGYEKIGRISKPNYCAECGAKMFGGER